MAGTGRRPLSDACMEAREFNGSIAFAHLDMALPHHAKTPCRGAPAGSTAPTWAPVQCPQTVRAHGVVTAKRTLGRRAMPPQTASASIPSSVPP